MSLLQEIFSRVHEELLEEAVDQFREFHGRNPSLAEEGSMYEQITSDKIKHRLSELIGPENIEMDPDSMREIESLLSKNA